MSQLERREFIKKTLMGGMGGALLPGDLRPEDATDLSVKHSVAKPPVVKKIIVDGAGMAGLCCAYELMKKGH